MWGSPYFIEGVLISLHMLPSECCTICVFGQDISNIFLSINVAYSVFLGCYCLSYPMRGNRIVLSFNVENIITHVRVWVGIMSSWGTQLDTKKYSGPIMEPLEMESTYYNWV